MEVRHLRLVESVAATGSLTRAAEQLFLSQSALSHQLKELEEELGAQLFIRAKKKMVLTQAGERFLETAENVLTELVKVKCDIEHMSREDAGTLRLTTGCYTCYHWLSPVLRTFKDKFPNVRIEVIPEATYNAFDYLLDGKVDLVFVSDRPDNAHLEFQSLFDDELMAVVAPDHPWIERKQIRARDFEKETLIMYDVPDQDSIILNEFFKASGTWPSNILRLKLTEAVIEMTKAQMGAAILAEWAIRPYVERGELIALPLARKVKRTWYSTRMKHADQPPFMQEFVKQLGNTLVQREI
ncbi:LysR family transcriptional regulator [Flavilitoribacter nigricans]|uniref:LysR family transcriptional regulator n=1 Tax=Flavilitoribacter nigricans (strain ATCC 23147 / DSM 23189 / NBRC 102662 / NCIMB 1420 / SS-2) TaxID=1122177 RepID=A0A2D0ND32_FLAN2|nr:LysR family transcriptional regulator [Flavilitoribacter nigricans]PHN06395.1 LysR family transcriptional regulator [Flavilitoribacter nigricans DSM 23189 = NBRC 102662]